MIVTITKRKLSDLPVTLQEIKDAALDLALQIQQQDQIMMEARHQQIQLSPEELQYHQQMML
jgi:hypothetical protein